MPSLQQAVLTAPGVCRCLDIPGDQATEADQGADQVQSCGGALQVHGDFVQSGDSSSGFGKPTIRPATSDAPKLWATKNPPRGRGCCAAGGHRLADFASASAHAIESAGHSTL